MSKIFPAIIVALCVAVTAGAAVETLLFDDFMCFDEGVLMGRVCREVIRRLRKSG